MEVNRRKRNTRLGVHSYPTHSYIYWKSSVPIGSGQIVRKIILKPFEQRDSVCIPRKKNKANRPVHRSAAKEASHSSRSYSVSFPKLQTTPSPELTESPNQSSTGIQTDRDPYPSIRPTLKLPVLHLSFYRSIGKSRDRINYK